MGALIDEEYQVECTGDGYGADDDKAWLINVLITQHEKTCTLYNKPQVTAAHKEAFMKIIKAN